MKHFLLSLVMGLVPLAGLAEDRCLNDTVVKVLHPDSVLITTGDSITQVQVYGRSDDNAYKFNYTIGNSPDALTSVKEHASNWDFALPFQPSRKKSSAQYTLRSLICSLGYSIPLQEVPETEHFSCGNISMELLQVHSLLPGKKDSWSIGFAYNANLMKQHKGNLWFKDEGRLSIMQFPDGTRKRKSLLIDTYFSFPLTYGHAFGNNWIHLSAIPELHIKPFVRNKFKADNREYEHSLKHFDRNVFGMSFRADFHFSDIIGIYVKYTPTYLFKKDQGPRFQLLTFGLTI